MIGNSVGLRVRPPQPYPENLNYTHLLQRMLTTRGRSHAHVENLCIGRSTIREVLEMGDTIYHSFPDVFIINAGITDCSTREIPLWFSNLIYSSRTSLFRNIAAAIHKFVIIPQRRRFVILRGKRSWTSPRLFRHYYAKLIGDLVKNTNGFLILMKINDCTDRVETQLPGTRANIARFNQIIEDLAQLVPQRTRLIEVGDLDPETDLPDGIHYSRVGHEKIAARLNAVIEEVCP
ncbi:MAG TPA: SGNH/GDSL hydrolase family protein [Aliiroseovarius sp.]|nr:SGNH/GDSL hydrolase family protein [Aliiroseovarius sp.]